MELQVSPSPSPVLKWDKTEGGLGRTKMDSDGPRWTKIDLDGPRDTLMEGKVSLWNNQFQPPGLILGSQRMMLLPYESWLRI